MEKMDDTNNASTTEAAFSDELLYDRLLLYVRTLRLPPQVGLRLVLRTMEERGGADGLAEMMESLKKHVREAGYGVKREELPLFSVPRYNRGIMPPARLASSARRTRPVV